MDTTRRCDASAVLGAAGWVVLVAVADFGPVTAAVLFAVLALVPAALPLAATPRRDGRHARPFRWAVAAQPPAAALFAVSALLTHGLLAAVLVLPWVGVTVLLAWFGGWRLVPRGLAPAEETLLDAGLLYLPVGALAAVAYRLDLGLGYGPTIVHLTAAHYHYATFLLPVVAAALGRRLTDRRDTYRVSAAVLVLGVPLVAAGITASPALEAVAATVFAAAVLVVAALFAGTAVAVRREDSAAAGLLAVAAASVTVAMALAVAYAVGQWTGPRFVGVARMIPTHGLLNAFGFALPAVLAWRRLDPSSRARPPGLPFSTLTARGRVGPDYAESNGLAGDPLAGQIDDVDRYAGDGFDPEALAPAVRRFYERTAEYRLTYRTDWHPPFRRGAGLATALTRRVEQLNLPTDGAVHEMVGRCPALAGEDPRDTPRFWVRTDPTTGEGVFVATYGVHERDGTAYMNIGMPLPGANLTAVLEPSNVGAGLELSSVPDHGDDAGLWLVVPGVGPIKLPVYELFRVWPADDPEAPDPPDGVLGSAASEGSPEQRSDGVLGSAASEGSSDPSSDGGDYDLTATHDMWLLGRKFLTIQYGIERDQALIFEGA